MVSLDPTEGSEQAGTRPVVVVSRDSINHNAINRNRTVVLVAIPITDRDNLDQLYPCHVEIRKGTGGTTKDSVVLCEQIRSIAPEQRLVRYMGRMPEGEMRRIEDAIRITLDLD
jgi:mRNA interferase MazF